ncbi:nitroreductase family deazaflavin-dependent oxidoreductase [Rhodococcus artemisiae]|uniref:Nitroreductase family deazaflavin-dependent oxidoreductase n=1 Tax=Rhodococcus artemisiae TaxID=714159 RepID=A0ABU7LCQ2_9NOCA|nr:nitroreductase family deazaflavin-dependent oxidoreductase [Rhodococcus artemisiae]MEE2059334.1 nitroreductase family deazaflavin-dependent oxidoreductase [Rhodococcus artemisiae]
MAETEYTQTDISLRGDEHIRVYRESGGKEGYIWNGVPTLLLTVTGRRSGKPKTSALIFARDGDDYLVVASKGGAPQHPLWYVNLQADPHAEVQVQDRTMSVVARTATPEEKPRLWKIVTEAWPNYDLYQSRTDREIPVVVLSPT